MGSNRQKPRPYYSRSPKAKRRQQIRGVVLIAGSTFLLAILVSLTSEFFLQNATSLALAFLLLWTIILVGVGFDAIGVAATAAQEPPFHAKAAEKVRGAMEAVQLIRRADRVASFCNDMVGDVCGTISGTIGAAIVLRLLLVQPGWSEVIATVIMSGLIAAATVGGKALGKTFAINQANDIIFAVGRVLSWWGNLTGRTFMLEKKGPKRRAR